MLIIAPLALYGAAYILCTRQRRRMKERQARSQARARARQAQSWRIYRG